MKSRTGKIILFIVVVFFIFVVFTSPTKAADIVGSIWDIIVEAFNSIVTFFNSLLNQ